MRTVVPYPAIFSTVPSGSIVFSGSTVPSGMVIVPELFTIMVCTFQTGFSYSACRNDTRGVAPGEEFLLSADLFGRVDWLGGFLKHQKTQNTESEIRMHDGKPIVPTSLVLF